MEDKARPILRGEAEVLMRRTAARPPDVERPARGAGAVRGPFDEGLFDALRSWRAAEAKAQSVPPYLIFHDSTLREIVQARPGTLDELAQVKGVGASKLQRYGTAVLRILGI